MVGVGHPESLLDDCGARRDVFLVTYPQPCGLTLQRPPSRDFLADDEAACSQKGLQGIRERPLDVDEADFCHFSPVGEWIDAISRRAWFAGRDYESS